MAAWKMWVPDAEKREQGKVYSKKFILTPECGVALQFINAVLYIYKTLNVCSLNFHIFVTVQQQIYIFPGICRYKSGKTLQALLDRRL